MILCCIVSFSQRTLVLIVPSLVEYLQHLDVATLKRIIQVLQCLLCSRTLCFGIRKVVEMFTKCVTAQVNGMSTYFCSDCNP